MVTRSSLGRVFTLSLVYVPNNKQDAFLGGFIFLLPSSENLTTEGDLSLTLNFPVDISDIKSQEFDSSGPFLMQNIQSGVLAEQVLPSPKTDLFYSHNHLLIPPVDCISLLGSTQDSLTQTKRGQMSWSVSLSALTIQKDYLVNQEDRKCELNNFLFNSFLELELETCTNQICFHNDTLHSSSLCGIYKVVLKRELMKKTSETERGENAERRFLTSEIKNLEVYKTIRAKKMLNKLLFLGCLLHALVLEKTPCILYKCRQKYSKTEKKIHTVTVHKERSQKENHIVVVTGKHNRKIQYLLRRHVREIRIQVKAQHLKEESEGTKSLRGPDLEKSLIKLCKALKDHFLLRLAVLICYFLDIRPLPDTLKETGNSVFKAGNDKGDFPSHRDVPLLATQFRRFAEVPTATLASALPKVLCTTLVKTSQRQWPLENVHILLMMRHSDFIMLRSGILISLRQEKACGHLKWKFRKEILIEDEINKWTEVVLYKLIESSLLSRQTWNSYSPLPVLFALFGEQFVKTIRMNKSNLCLKANTLMDETKLSLKETLLEIQTASDPLHLRTFQLPKLIILIHKPCEFDVQVKIRSGYKFILRWSNATESTG